MASGASHRAHVSGLEGRSGAAGGEIGKFAINNELEVGVQGCLVRGRAIFHFGKAFWRVFPRSAGREPTWAVTLRPALLQSVSQVC